MDKVPAIIEVAILSKDDNDALVHCNDDDDDHNDALVECNGRNWWRSLLPIDRVDNPANSAPSDRSLSSSSSSSEMENVMYK